MEEQRFFKPRYPLDAPRRRLLEATLIPHGQPFDTDFNNVPEAEQFQNIACGTRFVTEFIIGTLLYAPAKNCPHCRDISLLEQARIMGLIETEQPVTDAERYELLKRAIRGFQRNGRQQSAVLALKQMLSIAAFQRLINVRQYGKDISLLEYAIAYGDGKALLVLIDRGATVNTSSFLMGTPLHFAVQECKDWAVVQLLEHGADPTARNLDNLTPQQLLGVLQRNAPSPELRAAYAALNNLFIVTRSVYGSQLDQKEKQHGNRGENHLHFAVRSLNEWYVLQLLRDGVNANLPDNTGFNPLMCMFTPLCVEDNTLSLIFFRMTVYEQFPNLRGAHFDNIVNFLLDGLMRTGLITFIQENIYRIEYHRVEENEELSPWLLNVLAVTRYKCIARLLFEHTDLMLVDNSHKPVFYHALNSHCTSLCLELFEAASRKVENFLEYCCKTFVNMFYLPDGKLALSFWGLKLFLQCCQKISSPETQLSLLHVAILVLQDTPEACEFISWLIYAEAPFADVAVGIPIKRGQRTHFIVSQHDANARDDKGETPLFLAIRLNKLGFVKVLATKGAGFNYLNDATEFPRDVAYQTGDEEMIEFVEEAHQKATEITDENARLLKRYRRDERGKESSAEECSSDEENMSEEEESESSPRLRR